MGEAVDLLADMRGFRCRMSKCYGAIEGLVRLAGTTDLLQQTATQAVDALTRNLTCGIPAVEVGAAKSVLDQAIKAVELVDLAERIEALEQAAEQAAERERGTRR